MAKDLLGSGTLEDIKDKLLNGNEGNVDNATKATIGNIENLLGNGSQHSKEGFIKSLINDITHSLNYIENDNLLNVNNLKNILIQEYGNIGEELAKEIILNLPNIKIENAKNRIKNEISEVKKEIENFEVKKVKEEAEIIKEYNEANEKGKEEVGKEFNELQEKAQELQEKLENLKAELKAKEQEKLDLKEYNKADNYIKRKFIKIDIRETKGILVKLMLEDFATEYEDKNEEDNFKKYIKKFKKILEKQELALGKIEQKIEKQGVLKNDEEFYSIKSDDKTVILANSFQNSHIHKIFIESYGEDFNGQDIIKFIDENEELKKYFDSIES